MKFNLYSFRDVKTSFGQPFCEQSDEAAKRGFSFAVNNPEGIMNFAPTDFELYRIGTFNAVSGQLEPEQVPVFIVNGSSVFGG